VTFFFTFDFATPHRDHYVRIEAENYWRARETMIAACGTDWSIQYSEDVFTKLLGRLALVPIALAEAKILPGSSCKRGHASWIVVKADAHAVWIEDQDGAISVTNAAEEVVRELFKIYGERRIVYKDTEGNWDELLHRGARFTGFAPARGWRREALPRHARHGAARRHDHRRNRAAGVLDCELRAMMNATDFKPGDKVIYIPGIAHGDLQHEACERGVVSSTNAVNVFVRYYRNGVLQATAESTSPEDLVFEGSKTVINPAAPWPFPERKP